MNCRVSIILQVTIYRRLQISELLISTNPKATIYPNLKLNENTGSGVNGKKKEYLVVTKVNVRAAL